LVIILRLDTKSGVPPYRQIAQQIRHALVAAVLKPGDQLPTVKEVVTQLAINPNTVFKAYRELEHEGLVEGRPGAGTFVTRRPPGPPPGTHAAMARSLAHWVERARAAGLDDTSIESLMREIQYAGGSGFGTAGGDIA
jgi:GntR family transcriptional regulator